MHFPGRGLLNMFAINELEVCVTLISQNKIKVRLNSLSTAIEHKENVRRAWCQCGGTSGGLLEG